MIVLSAAAAPTAAHGPDPLLGGLYPQNATLGWTWHASGTPPSWMRTAISAGATDATATRFSKAPSFVQQSNGKGAAQYGTGVPCGINGLACARRYLPDDFLIGFREQGHVFDWGSLRWCQYYASPPNGCYDVENITLDELGHVAVLDHHVNYASQSDYLDAVVQTVSRTKPSTGWNAHAFARCDVATLQREYGLLLASTKISTCLDLATTLGLGVSKTSIAYGQSVTFTATLRTASSTAYKRLSAQALSGRSVQIQRRAIGTTAWQTVGTMASSSPVGNYTYAFAPGVTNEWRAVFSAPSSEGLRTSFSGVVRVTVGPCSGSTCHQL
jgi:hypothetical protein